MQQGVGAFCCQKTDSPAFPGSSPNLREQMKDLCSQDSWDSLGKWKAVPTQREASQTSPAALFTSSALPPLWWLTLPFPSVK